MADKVAVYAGTENIYPQMYTALKSLLLNNQMDRVYLLIETDSFPYDVPDFVTLINVAEQPWFKPGSPNFKNRYSYMTLMRCVLGELFEKEERILWLDCDTIVNDDISDLFNINMNGYMYAAVMEPGKSKDIFRYVNAGVLLCNLELLRLTAKELEMVHFLNTFQFPWLDQDVINLLCQGRIRLIGSEYNTNHFTMECLRPKIIHYAAIKDYTNEWAYKKYEAMELPIKHETEDVDNDDR